jgi:hypothetical protein
MVSLVALALAAPAFALTEIATWTTIKGSSTGTSHWSDLVEGDTLYSILTASSSKSQLVKVSNLSGTQSQQILTNLSGSGLNATISPEGLSSYGNYLQFADKNTGVYRVDKTTNTLSQYVSAAQLGTVGTSHTANLYSKSTTLPVPLALSGYGTISAGEVAVFDGGTSAGNIVITTGAGSATILVAQADLPGTQVDTNTGLKQAQAITFDGSGNLYWSNAGSVYRRLASGGTIETVLDASVLKLALGHTPTTIPELFVSPNGYLWGYENTSPRTVFRSYLQANSSALAIQSLSTSIGSLSWYNNQLTYNPYGANGLWTVPEPATLAFLGLGGIALLRRRG